MTRGSEELLVKPLITRTSYSVPCGGDMEMMKMKPMAKQKKRSFMCLLGLRCNGLNFYF